MVRGGSHSRGETYREIQIIATRDFIYLVGFLFLLFWVLFVCFSVGALPQRSGMRENAATTVSECDWWQLKVEASGQAEHLSPRGGKTNYVGFFINATVCLAPNLLIEQLKVPCNKTHLWHKWTQWSEGSIPAMLHHRWEMRDENGFLPRGIFSRGFSKEWLQREKQAQEMGIRVSVPDGLHGAVCVYNLVSHLHGAWGAEGISVSLGTMAVLLCTAIIDRQPIQKWNRNLLLLCILLLVFFVYVLQAFFKHSLASFQILPVLQTITSDEASGKCKARLTLSFPKCSASGRPGCHHETPAPAGKPFSCVTRSVFASPALVFC